MADIGIFASLDPVALDQACVDAVYASPDPGKAALIERMESRNGIRTIEAAAELGLGSRANTTWWTWTRKPAPARPRLPARGVPRP